MPKVKRRVRKKRSSSLLARAAFCLRHISLWCILGGTSYLIWLDHSVGQAFAVPQWSLPTRIYASAVELYVGMKLPRGMLLESLEELGYVRTVALSGSGQFVVTVDSFDLFTRGHDFPGGVEPPRKVSIQISHGSVSNILDYSTREALLLVRLEPLEIGSMHTTTFEDRVLVSLHDVPAGFFKALVAVEDRRYFEHRGVDLIGIGRALMHNVASQRIGQGASTITQQLIKNTLLSNERSYGRKLREALMAISLERRYSKSAILGAYVNEIFLGQDGNRAIHGFGLGAKYFFGKRLSELTLAESATLIGMIKAPSTYDPRRHPEASRKRRNVVLRLMLQRGVVERAEYEDAVASQMVVRTKSQFGKREFSAFIDLVRSQLKRNYSERDLQTAGLKIYTTLDPWVQKTAQDSTAVALSELEHAFSSGGHSLQAAVIIAEPRTAEIKSVVGARDAVQGGFNRALNARRPIGSLVKPFVYLTALEKTESFNVLSRLQDVPVNLATQTGEVWTPQNYDGKFHGEIPLRHAFVQSRNLATVNLGLTLGVQTVVRRLKAFGFEREIEDFPSLLLGAIDLSPLEVSQLYQGLANSGFQVPLRAIRTITNSNNETLKRYPAQVEQVADASSAYLMQYLLSQVVTTGTASRAGLRLHDRLPLAGKTGTSNDGRDSWFAGFGGNYLGVVWVGRDDNGATRLTGSSGALKVWIDLMEQIEVTPIQFGNGEKLNWQWLGPGGNAIVGKNCPGAMYVPVAEPHALAVDEQCELRRATEPELWDNIRNIFH